MPDQMVLQNMGREYQRGEVSGWFLITSRINKFTGVEVVVYSAMSYKPGDRNADEHGEIATYKVMVFCPVGTVEPRPKGRVLLTTHRWFNAANYQRELLATQDLRFDAQPT